MVLPNASRFALTACLGTKLRPGAWHAGNPTAAGRHHGVDPLLRQGKQKGPLHFVPERGPLATFGDGGA